MVKALLQSKISPPRLRKVTITRPDLGARLDEGLSAPLILVCAPAGYGKSTLVASWLADHARDSYAAWLTLDAEDNDVNRFATYLQAALVRIIPHLQETLHNSLHSANSGPPGLVAGGEPLVALLNELANLDHKLLVVLDDYHVITNIVLHKILLTLLNYLPETVTFVVITRVDPPLPLARLRSQGALVSLRAVDLRFTTEEAAVFLRTVMGRSLTDEQVATLAKRTEGWVTGLQLAGLSLQQYADADEFLQDFAGDNHNIRSYLLDEVLAGQPPEVRRFLLATSILPQLTAPLCEATLVGLDGAGDGQQDRPGTDISAQQILEYLEQHNLFITALDEHSQWYRYHTLFAELLRFHLWRENREMVAALRACAGQWLDEHGLHHGLHPVTTVTDGHAFARGTREQMILRRSAKSPAGGLQESLSERENDVLELLAKDLSYHEIAERLFISLPTVKTHITHIYGKLGVHNREEALIRAHTLGIFYP